MTLKIMLVEAIVRTTLLRKITLISWERLNGQEAVMKFSNLNDLVIMDITVMNGIEATREIKKIDPKNINLFCFRTKKDDFRCLYGWSRGFFS